MSNRVKILAVLLLLGVSTASYLWINTSPKKLTDKKARKLGYPNARTRKSADEVYKKITSQKRIDPDSEKQLREWMTSSYPRLRGRSISILDRLAEITRDDLELHRAVLILSLAEKHPNSETRRIIASTYSEYPTFEARQHLQSMLSDPSQENREYVQQCLVEQDAMMRKVQKAHRKS